MDLQFYQSSVYNARIQNTNASAHQHFFELLYSWTQKIIIIAEKIESLSALVESGSSNAAGAAVETQSVNTSPSAFSKFIYFQSGGKYRMVPAAFVFPGQYVSVKTALDLWFFGNSKLS